MNRREFCTLYHLLRTESPLIVEGLSDNIFKALGFKNEYLIFSNSFIIKYKLMKVFLTMIQII